MEPVTTAETILAALALALYAVNTALSVLRYAAVRHAERVSIDPRPWKL